MKLYIVIKNLMKMKTILNVQLSVIKFKDINVLKFYNKIITQLQFVMVLLNVLLKKIMNLIVFLEKVNVINAIFLFIIFIVNVLT